MQFRTEFRIGPLVHQIKYDSRILFTGSCFSAEIGSRMADLKFKILKNPSGIIYNPVSLANELNYYCKKTEIDSGDLIESGGIFRHYDFHGSLAHPDKNNAAGIINTTVKSGHEFLKTASHLIITFGTSIVYRLRENGKIVANNHKMPAGLFEKYQLSVAEMIDEWSGMMQLLFQFNPALQIIFTVSPVRHIKDGMIENQISKSILHIAIAELIKSPQTYYFPSYELMMDDLRDYRFYKSDLIHPNEMAVDYIMEKFKSNCIDASVFPVMEAIHEIQTAKMHRPFFPDTEEHQLFMQKMHAKTKILQQKYPEIDLEEEMEYFSN